MRYLHNKPILYALAFILSAAPRSGVADRSDSAEAAASSETGPDETVHRVVYYEDNLRREVSGRMLIEASNGLLVQSDDGTLHTIHTQSIEEHQRTDEVFRPATHEELAERLLAELPSGFRTHITKHYVVCYGTSRTYAKWTSSLLEKLHRAFTNFWEHEGFELHEPEFPLVAMVYPDRGTYQQAAVDQVGQISSGVVGYYSLQSNRVNMYDLTGVEALRGPGNRRGSLKQINRMLSQPSAVPLVSTIVHEATHQIAFNCGLQTRFAAIPLWICEGLAVVFEAPDLSSARGWQGIGKVNYMRLRTFRENRPQWTTAKLMSLLADDQRFRNPRTAPVAYADAWALNFYLIKYRPREYTAYLQALAAKPQMQNDDAATRLAEFREHFGDIADFERDFLKQMDRMR